MGEGIYEFEYQLPGGRDRLAYYYLVNYSIDGNGTLTPQEAYTKVETIQIVNRYVLSLEVNRGPVGARISILGRGFTAQHRNGLGVGRLAAVHSRLDVQHDVFAALRHVEPLGTDVGREWVL